VITIVLAELRQTVITKFRHYVCKQRAANSWSR
jgi:hypothetical protein